MRDYPLHATKAGIIQSAGRSGQDRAVVIQLNEGGLRIMQPTQRFQRYEAGLRDHDKALDPARRFCEAPGTALSADSIAHGEMPAIDGDLDSVAAQHHDAATDGHGAGSYGSLLVHLEFPLRVRRLRLVSAGRGHLL